MGSVTRPTPVDGTTKMTWVAGTFILVQSLVPKDHYPAPNTIVTIVGRETHEVTVANEIYPLLTISKEREPDYARRVGETVEPVPGDGAEAILVAAEQAAAAEPVPDIAPVAAVERAVAGAEAKRERRRQRRRSRPHGRAR